MTSTCGNIANRRLNVEAAFKLVAPAAAALLSRSQSHQYQHAAYPSPETSRQLYDELDYIRGVEVWLRHVPTAALVLSGNSIALPMLSLRRPPSKLDHHLR